MKAFPFDIQKTYNAGCWYNDEFYFSANNFNGLFRYNPKTKKEVFISMFEKSPAFMFNIHREAYLWGDKIVFVPYRAGYVSVFNITSQEIECICVSSIICGMGSALIDDVLWIFGGYKDDCIARVDLLNKEVSSFPVRKSIQEIDKNVEFDKVWNFYSDVIVINDVMYGALWNTDYIVKFDLVEKEYSLIMLDQNFRVANICYSNNKLYLSQISSYDIISYDINSSEVSCYSGKSVIDEIETTKEQKYCLLAAYDNSVFCVPEEGDVILKTDEIGKKVELYSELSYKHPSDTTDVRKRWKRYIRYEIIDGKVVIFPYRDGVEIVISDGKITPELLKYSDNINDIFLENYKELYIDSKKNEDIIFETPLYTLKDFISKI